MYISVRWGGQYVKLELLGQIKRAMSSKMAKEGGNEKGASATTKLHTDRRTDADDSRDVKFRTSKEGTSSSQPKRQQTVKYY